MVGPNLSPARVIGPTAIAWALLAAAVACPLAAFAQEPAKLQITALELGFNGVYKLGCWTQAAVTLQGGDEAFTGVVEMTLSDPEGVPTVVVSPPSRAVAVVPGQATVARLFVRPGQEGAAIAVRVLDDRGRERARRSFYPGPEAGGEIITGGLPSTNRVIASFGSRRGVGDVFRGEAPADDERLATRTVIIDDASDLPLEWYGYESLDTLVLVSDQAELFRPLAAAPQRIDALARWVELGGRVVVFCGVDAPELIGPDAPLAPLAPGVFDKLVPLRESQPLEAFVNSDVALVSGRQFQLQVPRLAEVRGRVLAYAGPDPADLPLAVRARRGLGEITFIAVDPDAAPLADWPGRVNLLRRALAGSAEQAEAGQGAYVQSEDLIDRLRRALDSSFEGVKTAPFALVALLVILYILLIGPGDYFLVKRVLRRMELTWITFPVIALSVSTAAYWAAHAMKGDQLRVNQVEIVDVDLSTGQARGTVWTHFFSPRVDRYDLTLHPAFGASEPGRPRPQPSSEPERPRSRQSSEPGGSPPRSPSLVAWLGATGAGLDGMQGRHGQTGLFDQGYSFSPPLDALLELPVQEWSTKTLVGRWSDELVEPIDAQLQPVGEDQLAGKLTNRTGVALRDCVLMRGKLAYRLPDLADGAAATVDDSVRTSSVKTALIDREAGVESASLHLDAATLDVDRLAIAMMFHESLGGVAYAQSPNRYQAFTDLSRLLAGDQAVLLARAPDGGSQWQDGDAPLASDQDRRWVYYRFVIPLEQSGQ